MNRIRKRHGKKAKFDAALDALKGNQTMAELCQKYGVNQSVLHRWKKELLDKGPDLFGMGKASKGENEQVEKLQRKIGELTMDIDFLKKNLME